MRPKCRLARHVALSKFGLGLGWPHVKQAFRNDCAAISALRAIVRIYAKEMCRNIRPLNNFEPPATDDEVHAAALQYVRKVAGSTKPSKANEEAFNKAVAEIAHITAHLIADLVTTAPPKDRDQEAIKARQRSEKRFAS